MFYRIDDNESLCFKLNNKLNLIGLYEKTDIDNKDIDLNIVLINDVMSNLLKENLIEIILKK